MSLVRHDVDGARAVDDEYQAVAEGDDVPERGAVLLPLASWSDALAGRSDPVGVHVPGDTDPAALAPLLGAVSLIAIDFPKFTDGRGYSLARMLREEHGYAGELRAVGDVLRDQLFYLARVGFDSFALKDGKSVQDAIAAFADFSDKYQPAADGVPAGWRRS